MAINVWRIVVLFAMFTISLEYLYIIYIIYISWKSMQYLNYIFFYKDSLQNETIINFIALK